jgi:hypothetical protein
MTAKINWVIKSMTEMDFRVELLKLVERIALALEKQVQAEEDEALAECARMAKADDDSEDMPLEALANKMGMDISD